MGTGKTYSTKYLLDSNNSSGVAGQVLSTTSTGIDWVDANTVPGTGLWLASGNNIYNSNSGNVGIGTTSPDAKLEVAGGSTGIILSNLGDSSAYDAVAMTYNGYNSGTPEFIFQPKTNPGSGTVNSYFRFKNRVSGGSNISNVTVEGKVGIGTPTPVSKLSIDAGAQQDAISINSSDGDGPYAVWRRQNGTIGFVGNANALSLSGNTNFGVRATNDLVFAVGGATERMRIFSNGNVNIGVAETGSSAVTGPFVVTHTSSRFLTASYEESTVSLSAKNNNNNLESLRLAGDSIKFFNGTNAVGSQTMVILNSGNVGIGTTSPSYKLQIGVAGGLADSIRIGSYAVAKDTRQYIGYARADSGLFESSGNGDTPSTVLAGVAGIRIVNTTGTLASGQADNSVQLLTHIYNGGSRVALHANYNGNVGIGTTSPSEKLEVSGSNTLSIKLSRNNTDATYITTLTNNYSATLGTELKSGTYNILTHGNSTGTALNFTNGAMTFDFRNSEYMRITDAGNVGIGTTSPRAKLDVNGGTGDAAAQQPKIAVTRTSSTGNVLVGKMILTTKPNDTTNHGNLVFQVKTTASSGESSAYYTDAITIDGKNANVGIGTTSPGVKLHVSESSSGSTVNLLYLENTGSGGNEGVSIKFNPMFGATSMIASNREGADSGKTNLTFHNCLVNDQAPIERMRIDSAGAIKFNAYGAGTLVTDASGNITASSGGGAGGPFLPLAGGTMTGTGSIIMPNSFTLRAGNSNNSAPAYTFRDDTNTGMFQDIDDALSFSAGGATVLHMDGNDAYIPRYITHLGDTNTYFGFVSNDNFIVATSGAERIRINSSGNVGIGTTGPGNKLEVTGIIEATVGATGGFAYGANPPSKQGLMISVSNTGGDAFSGAGRIENTSTTNSSSAVLVLRQTNSASFSTITQYRQGSGTQGNLVGFVRVTTTNTIFSTSGSDKRLKKNITNWTDDTLGKFKALQPKKFRYKIQDVSEEKTSGFIAQNEVANFPEAYILNKENEEDDAMYSFNPMGMTTHLMKAIKDLVEKVEILENKITQLENNN